MTAAAVLLILLSSTLVSMKFASFSSHLQYCLRCCTRSGFTASLCICRRHPINSVIAFLCSVSPTETKTDCSARDSSSFFFVPSLFHLSSSWFFFPSIFVCLLYSFLSFRTLLAWYWSSQCTPSRWQVCPHSLDGWKRKKERKNQMKTHCLPAKQ